MTPRRTTLKDIADAVGKSRMTVSLALRGDPKISDKTVKEIRKVAKRMGYQSDPEIVKLMKHLRENKTVQLKSTLAYLNNHKDKNIRHKLKDVDSFYAKAQEYAWECGYKLKEFWVHEPGFTPQRISQIIHAQGIEGIIVGPSDLDNRELNLDWSHFSSITLGYSLLKPDLHRAITNRRENALIALRQLQKNGYERIGCAVWSDLDNLIHHSYTAAISSFNVDQPRSKQAILFRPKKWNKVNFIAWFRQLQPDAIFGSPDCIKWLKEEGVRMPEDVAFAMELDLAWDIDYSGTKSNLDQLAKVLVNQLLDQIGRGEKGVPENPITSFIKGNWHPGVTAPVK